MKSFILSTARPSYVFLAVVSVCIVLVMTVTVFIYVKFKIDVTLFLRDTLRCHRSPSGGSNVFGFVCFTSILPFCHAAESVTALMKLLFSLAVCVDGKSYDAFLLCYNSETDAGLKDCDKKTLENVLETFGYNLCLFDRDVIPGGGMLLFYIDDIMTYCLVQITISMKEVTVVVCS